MFNQDIDTEIAILQEEKVLEKQSKLKEIYTGEKSQIQARIKKLRNKLNQWKNNGSSTFDSICDEIKTEILSKQES